jgi:hypothetical protein
MLAHLLALASGPYFALSSQSTADDRSRLIVGIGDTTPVIPLAHKRVADLKSGTDSRGPLRGRVASIRTILIPDDSRFTLHSMLLGQHVVRTL